MSEFVRRRHSVAAKFTGGVVVLAAAPIAIRNNDVEHEYRQDSDLYYLTGFDEPECVLVLPTAHTEHHMVLFVRPRDPERETWDGARLGVEGAKERLGADAVFPIGELETRLPDYLVGHDRVLHRFGRNRAFDDLLVRALEVARHRARRGGVFPMSIEDPAGTLHEARLQKSEVEIAAMKRAAQITGAAHVAAMRHTRAGRFEYEIEAVLRQAFRSQGSERPAYPPIVASGPNATTLHYRTNNRQLGEGDLLLVDAGCEFDYYAADVTRTWPVSARFSEAQRIVYDIVLRAQLESIRAIRPGATLDDVHRASVETIVDGLLDNRILVGKRSEILEQGKHRPYYMHRTSHWLGMDVHDVGLAQRQGKPRPLEPGMVITVEPGLYFKPQDETVPAPFRGIGVRIEDDLVVVEGGSLNLTDGIPKQADEIERICGSA